MILGWVGSSSTSPYLHLLDAVLDRLVKQHDLVLRVIGGEYEHPTIKVELLPFDIDREPADVAAFDVGLLPEPDDAWTRGKGAFKGLLYMAAGIPVVASDVGVNREVIGDAGCCVSTNDEWVSALDRLIREPSLRQRLGDAGRRRVTERYSVDVHAPRLAAVIRSVVETSNVAA